MTTATSKVSARRQGKAAARAKAAAVVKKAGAPGHVLNGAEVPHYQFRTDIVPPLLTFVVYGIPAGQGSKRYAGHRNGKPVLKEQSDAVEPWRDAVREMSKQAIRAWVAENGRPWVALDEPVMVSPVVTVPGSEAATRRGDIYATGTPDLDKMERAIGDALAPTPLKPSDGTGYSDTHRERIRATMMADRRKQAVLHDDSRIVAWDHALKVYPSTTADSLGFSGVTIRIWRMRDLDAAARRPRWRDADGVWWMTAADLATWARPLTLEPWADAAARLWADPDLVLAAPVGPVLLRGRGVADPALRSILRALALTGPQTLVEVFDEPFETETST